MKGLIEGLNGFFKRNGSTILTCAGAAGVIATAIVSAKNTPRALELIKTEEVKKGDELTKIEKLKTAAPAYIPAALVAVGTIGCIFGANILNKRQQASLVSLYSLLDSSFKQYKDAAISTYGEDANDKINNAMAKIHFEDSEVPEESEDRAIFMDLYSLQIFQSTMEEVESAEKFINDLLHMRGYACLNEFYTALGIDSIDTDFDTGWSLAMLRSQGYENIEFKHERIDREDGKSCVTITMVAEPNPYYVY